MKDLQFLKKMTTDRVVHVKAIIGIWVIVGVLATGAWIVKSINDWSAVNKLAYKWPINIQFRLPVTVEKREPLQVLSPIAKEIIAPTADALTPIERKIVDKWGERYGYIALAVFRCESGLRPEAVNWSSKDVGIAQINWPIWEKPIKEKFGYTLVDMFDVDKHLEVAYWISDRDLDGKDINLEPWVVFNNGTFRGCIK